MEEIQKVFDGLLESGAELARLPQGPVLILCPVPIGNDGDITIRALLALTRADLLLCEDTRKTGLLLARMGLGKKPLRSYHDHNERDTAELLVREIQNDQLLAVLVSDAGTPGISDPGYHLVDKAHANGLNVEALPGASAVPVFVSSCGLPNHKFTFHGFLPAKKQALSACLGGLETQTLHVFYESPRRAAASIQAMCDQWPDAQVCVARELTKTHAQMVRFDASQWSPDLVSAWKGEFVLGLYLDGPGTHSPAELAERIELCLAQEMRPKAIVRKLKDSSGLTSGALYDQIVAAQKKRP